jgi:16S rRNA G1207 methylase RsmC
VTHYFDADQPPTEGAFCFRARLGGREAVVASQPGVFSQGRLDPGTAVLLRWEERQLFPPSHDAVHQTPSGPPGASGASRPALAGSDLVDLGCGWGPLALTMASWAPDATVWAVDVNPRALESTARNARRLGLDNIRPVTPAEAPKGLTADLIWSNPPVRIGKAALHGLLTEWLGRLAVGGWADLVVQKNLGADSLAAWLTGQAGLPTVKLASSKGYRVLRAVKG